MPILGEKNSLVQGFWGIFHQSNTGNVIGSRDAEYSSAGDFFAHNPLHLSFVMSTRYRKGDRVKVLATRFDVGTEDDNGDTFSVIHGRQGNGLYCYGTVSFAYSRRSHPNQTYRILYDSGPPQMKSLEDHMLPALEGDGDDVDEGGSSGDENNEDEVLDGNRGEGDEGNDAVLTDDEDDPYANLPDVDGHRR